MRFVMSLMSWLAKTNPSFQEPRLPGLPNPNDSAAAADGLLCSLITDFQV